MKLNISIIIVKQETLLRDYKYLNVKQKLFYISTRQSLEINPVKKTCQNQIEKALAQLLV